MSTELLTLEGNLGANPVIKETPSGKKVCNFLNKKIHITQPYFL